MKIKPDITQLIQDLIGSARPDMLFGSKEEFEALAERLGIPIEALNFDTIEIATIEQNIFEIDEEEDENT
jgi:hypothetical protein